MEIYDAAFAHLEALHHRIEDADRARHRFLEHQSALGNKREHFGPNETGTVEALLAYSARLRREYVSACCGMAAAIAWKVPQA